MDFSINRIVSKHSFLSDAESILILAFFQKILQDIDS